jgi:hypothetical protein
MSHAGSVSTLHRGTGFQPVLADDCEKDLAFQTALELTIANTGWKPVPQLRVETEPECPFFFLAPPHFPSPINSLHVYRESPDFDPRYTQFGKACTKPIAHL